MFDLHKPIQNDQSTATNWSQKLDVKEEFNFFMWVHYMRDTQTVLMLHMTSFDKVQLMEVTREGDPKVISDVDIKNVNCVHQQGDCFYFASNVEDNMPIYIATVNGIKKISFEIKSDVTPIEFGFLKEGL